MVACFRSSSVAINFCLARMYRRVRRSAWSRKRAMPVCSEGGGVDRENAPSRVRESSGNVVPCPREASSARAEVSAKYKYSDTMDSRGASNRQPWFAQASASRMAMWPMGALVDSAMLPLGANCVPHDRYPSRVTLRAVSLILRPLNRPRSSGVIHGMSPFQ